MFLPQRPIILGPLQLWSIASGEMCFTQSVCVCVGGKRKGANQSLSNAKRDDGGRRQRLARNNVNILAKNYPPMWLCGLMVRLRKSCLYIFGDLGLKYGRIFKAQWPRIETEMQIAEGLKIDPRGYSVAIASCKKDKWTRIPKLLSWEKWEYYKNSHKSIAGQCVLWPTSSFKFRKGDCSAAGGSKVCSRFKCRKRKKTLEAEGSTRWF